ncbi:A24 family peptidase [Stieleria sp. JC731]|uniref:prepilin peptidase n=1 Tax=Pirellulaceae TaxID=2691357 RepID=UPI001E39D061|nr:A24 family peptidase [Stieleria sp. JC731]MCC9603578.1 A24 family peptidase [Stieleria sp. JC731]
MTWTELWPEWNFASFVLLINFWITLPIELRVGLVSLTGLLFGVLCNYAIYNFAWNARPIGPWAKPSPDAPNRNLSDRLPIVGWLGLRRESAIHGRGFWLRPALIEIAMMIGLPCYYWFATQTGQLLPIGFRGADVIALAEPWLTTVFLSHAVMIAIMVAATFIDFDEKTIPDTLTIPGTIFALICAWCSVWVFLPWAGPNGPLPTIFTAPAGVGNQWQGPQGWWTAIAIWSGWCFALANRRVILRRGLAKALEYFMASLVRNYNWKLLLAIWIVGAVTLRILYSIGGVQWIGLLSALVGLGVGGGVVWTIRIVGSVAMQREALGFGDVTLMAMVGAFIGWQGSVMAFFVSPIAAIVIVMIYSIVTRNAEIPFGPYLCAGTMLTIIWWDDLVGGWFIGNFAILGPFILWLFIALAGMMGVMLFCYRITLEWYRGK